MTKVSRISALASALALGASGVAVAQTAVSPSPASVTVKLAAQNSSGETGTATLAQTGPDVSVSVTMTGAGTVAQPIHIHQGTCAKLNPQPMYPLTTVQNGTSMTTLKNMTVSALQTGDFAINVHKSTTDIPDYVACGNIPKSTAKGAM
jgi:lipoprotein-anchoring transpeptidase ErfK/SrfK